MGKTIESLMSKSKDLGITLNPPAKISDLTELEDEMKQRLPDDLKKFYRVCNGLETFDYLFRVLPIKEILQYKSELKTSSFNFAEYMIFSDVWMITLIGNEEYSISNSNHHLGKNVVLTNSLLVFLERYLIGGIMGENGLYDWYEQKKDEH